MADGLAHTRLVPATVHIASAQPDDAHADTSADGAMALSLVSGPAAGGLLKVRGAVTASFGAECSEYLSW